MPERGERSTTDTPVRTIRDLVSTQFFLVVQPAIHIVNLISQSTERCVISFWKRPNYNIYLFMKWYQSNSSQFTQASSQTIPFDAGMPVFPHDDSEPHVRKQGGDR